MALGEGSKHWDACREEGVAGFGWDGVGDLKRYDSREQILGSLRELDHGDTSAVRMCWDFCHTIKLGDTIVVKQGRQRVTGHGIVTSDYRFEDSRPALKNVRNVVSLAQDLAARTRVPQLETVCTSLLT